MTADSSPDPATAADGLAGIGLGSLLGADPESMARGWRELASQLTENPAATWQIQLQYQVELANIWFGDTELELPADSRFADPQWQENPVFKRMWQSYVAWGRALDQWLASAPLQGIDRRRAEFLLDAIKDIYAPVNTPFTPEAIRRAAETNGESLVTGVQQFMADLEHNHGYPAVADRGAFQLGKDVATQPGAVVYRCELFELIQYEPTTSAVHKRPLLYVFSQVNRYYLGDLTADRSLFKQLLDNGIQVFAISWKNPRAEHAHWSLDSYAAAVIDAVRVVRSITRQRRIDLMGLCAGGIVATAAAGVLQARQDHWINSLSLFVSIIDNRPGENDFTLFATDETVAAQKARVRAQGTLSERDILEMFAMLRLDENVFSFVRSNYFRGESPLAHPLLFWSMDYTRVPAELQCDLIDLGHSNKLARGEQVILGQRVDLQQIDYPVYVMAGSTDHITPWHACYRSTALFGGKVTFVLTNQNHTQTISARPDNRHLRYWVDGSAAAAACPDPEQWLQNSQETQGNWRDHWVTWLQGHSDRKPAPATLGNKTYLAMEAAPGLYVSEP